MKIVALAIIAAGAITWCAAQESAGDFKTVSSGKFNFSYKVSGTDLVARVAYPTKGYLAVGFNPTRKMKGANIVIGYANGANGVVEDHYGVDDVVHTADTLIGGKNNVSGGLCTMSGDTAVLSFTIVLDSGDPKDVKLEAGKEIKVIFAAGASRDFRKHNALGKVKITL